MVIRALSRKSIPQHIVRHFGKAHNHSNLYERAKLHTSIGVCNRGKPRNTVLCAKKYSSANAPGEQKQQLSVTCDRMSRALHASVLRNSIVAGELLSAPLEHTFSYEYWPLALGRGSWNGAVRALRISQLGRYEKNLWKLFQERRAVLNAIRSRVANGCREIECIIVVQT